MQLSSKPYDVIEPSVVDAIDRLASSAPGVINWWVDLLPAAVSLHEEYTNRNTYPKSLRSRRPYAYLPLFTPRYLPRVRHALRAAGLNLTALLRMTNGFVRVLDMGAGTGILTVAFLLELERACKEIGVAAQVEAVLGDNDQNSLNVAYDLLEEMELGGAKQECGWPSVQLRKDLRRYDLLSDVEAGQFDIVLLGHVICEFYQRQDLDQEQANALLGQLFPVIEKQLSDRGVLIIIEPLDREHVSKPLWIRDYAQSASRFFVLAPCLGSSRRCPEWRKPYSGKPACSTSTYMTTWDDRTLAGHRLRLFHQAMLRERGITRSRPRERSYFFPLVLSLGTRKPVSKGVGMAVRRKALPNEIWKINNTEVVCKVGADGQEHIEAFTKFKCNANQCVLHPVHVLDGQLADFDDLSALYPSGWPVV